MSDKRLEAVKIVHQKLRELSSCLAHPCINGVCSCADEMAEALRAADAVDDCVRVPRKATLEMLRAAWRQDKPDGGDGSVFISADLVEYAEIYAAMIAAHEQKP